MVDVDFYMGDTGLTDCGSERIVGDADNINVYPYKQILFAPNTAATGGFPVSEPGDDFNEVRRLRIDCADGGSNRINCRFDLPIL